MTVLVSWYISYLAIFLLLLVSGVDWQLAAGACCCAPWGPAACWAGGAAVTNVSEGWKYVKADKFTLCERCF